MGRYGKRGEERVDAVVHVRTSEGLFNALQRRSKLHGDTFANLVRRYLTEGLVRDDNRARRMAEPTKERGNG